jgi:hypothetical protein
MRSSRDKPDKSSSTNVLELSSAGSSTEQLPEPNVVENQQQPGSSMNQIIMVSPFGDPVTKLNYFSVQKMTNFYKQQKVQKKSVKISDLLTSEAKWVGFTTICGKALNENELTEEAFYALDSETILKVFEKAYPKPENAGLGAVDMAQNIDFQLFPYHLDLALKPIYPLLQRTKEELLNADQEATVVGILKIRLSDHSVGASQQFIAQFVTAVTDSNPQNIQNFVNIISKTFNKINSTMDYIKNSLGGVISFENTYNQEIHINKKHKVDHTYVAGKTTNTDGKTAKPKPKQDMVCNGCGNTGHENGKYKCIYFFGEHPDVNHQFQKAFADSDKGKAYYDKFKRKSLSYQQTTGGTFKFDEMKTKFFEAVNARNAKQNKGNIYKLYNTNTSTNIYTLKCSVQLENNILSPHIIVNILIDTCALQANYASTKLLENLGGNAVIKNDLNQKVCSIGSCVSCSTQISFYITILNITSNKHETFHIYAYVLPNLNVDLIIGRPTIKENKLLNKVPLEGDDYYIPYNATLKLITTSNIDSGTNNNISHELCCMCENTILKINSTEYIYNSILSNNNIYYISNNGVNDILRSNLIEHPHEIDNTTQNNLSNCKYSSPSNYIGADILHELYKLSFKDFEENSPYNIKRLSKNEVLDPIPDDTYIDENKDMPLWEEYKENNTIEFLFGDDVDPIEKQKVLDVLNEYKHIFSCKLSRGPAKIPPFKLNVDDAQWEVKSNRQPARIFSKDKNKIIEELVKEQLEAGIIQPSQAPEVSQVVVVRKPDGGWRGCIDYIKLNLATKSLGWPIPNIQQLIHRIGSFRPKYLGKFDFTKGYWQAPLHPDSWRYTAFTCWMGNYEYTMLPMGLKGAPPWFQQNLATNVLYDLIHRILELYLDDLIFWGNTIDEYIMNLKLILDRFVQYNITPNPKKCIFLQKEITYLGYSLDREGIKFTDKKIEKALEVELPHTLKKLKQFVGVSVHFSRHIENYSEKARLLNKKLGNYNSAKNKHAKLYWNDEELTAFNNMISAIEGCQKLYFVDDDHEIYLQTDASEYGIAGYLYQVIDGNEHPVMFVSKALQNEQLNWHIEEKEQYAIVYSLEKMEFLVRDVHLVIRTDHENLTRINFGKSKKVYRWKLFIQSFDFDIEFIQGIKNEIPDALSRLTPDKSTNINNDAHELLIFENVIIPDDKYKIIESVHNQIVGHHGVERTFIKLNNYGHNWLNMKNHIKKFIKLCACCQKMSTIKPSIITHPFTIGTYEPMERIAIDTIGPLPTDELGFAYIVVIICCFSRYTTLHISKDPTAISAAEALLNHAANFGLPYQILSDMGSQYINEIIDQLIFMMGVEKLDTMPGIKEENSIVERRNKEVGEHLRDILFHKKIKNAWSKVIPLVQRIVNAEWVESTGVTPAQIIFGNSIDLDRSLFLKNKPDIENETNLPDSITTKSLSTWISDMLKYQKDIIEIAQNSQKELHLKYYNLASNKIPTDFAIGSYVLVKNTDATKIDQKWNGPFRVVNQDVKNKNRFTVQNLITGKLEDFPNKHLKPFNYDDNYTNPEDIALSDEQYFIVDKILAHKPAGKNLTVSTSKHKIKFQVLYKGDKNPLWIDYHILKDNEILHNYLTKNKLVRLIPSKYKWGKDGPPK